MTRKGTNGFSLFPHLQLLLTCLDAFDVLITTLSLLVFMLVRKEFLNFVLKVGCPTDEMGMNAQKAQLSIPINILSQVMMMIYNLVSEGKKIVLHTFHITGLPCNSDP